MTLQDIINNSRHGLGNYEPPYLWTDTELVRLANQVINDIALFTKCITDALTPTVCEIFTSSGTFDYLLHTSIIDIISAKVVTKEVLVLDTAPATAWATGDTLTGVTSLKTCKVLEKLTDYIYVVNYRTGLFTLGETISNGTVSAVQSSTYPKFNDYKYLLLNKDTASEMDIHYPIWRSIASTKPTRFILDYNTGYMTLYPVPDNYYKIHLSVHRYPTTEMIVTGMSGQTPELNAQLHDAIIDGILSRAFLKPGENTFNPKMASAHLALYSQVVGKKKVQDNMANGKQMTMAPHKGFM